MVLLLAIFLLWPFLSAAQEGEDQRAAEGAVETTAAGENPDGPILPPEPSAEGPEEGAPRKTEENTGEGGKGLGFLPRLGIAFAVILIQALLIRLIWALFKRLSGRAEVMGAQKLKPLKIKKLKLLDTRQIINAILFSLNIAKYLVTAFQLYITLPIIFSLFAATKQIAIALFNQVLDPLKRIFFGTIEYIPKLITIIVILLVTKYALRTLKFLASQIEKGKLLIPGFYPDWAQPTFNILRVLLYAFTVAIIYPYLPGSDSKFFQGISVFVGLIFSLGSSSVISNLVAGMVITYMRPFKIGDFIKIKGITGTVVEKSLFVVRLRDKKNEYTTFPNVTVLSSEIVNYNTSAENDQGLVIHAGMTMGYAVPWPEVHKILIAAAKKTSRTEKEPKPFVLQTALDDFYAHYEVNVYTREINELPGIYSELYGNIQDGFREAGLDLTAPHYEIYHGPDDGTITRGKM